MIVECRPAVGIPLWRTTRLLSSGIRYECMTPLGSGSTMQLRARAYSLLSLLLSGVAAENWRENDCPRRQILNTVQYFFGL